MKVKELIERLKFFNPEMEVRWDSNPISEIKCEAHIEFPSDGSKKIETRIINLKP